MFFDYGCSAVLNDNLILYLLLLLLLLPTFVVQTIEVIMYAFVNCLILPVKYHLFQFCLYVVDTIVLIVIPVYVKHKTEN